MNYDLKFDSGELYPGQAILRARALNEKGSELQNSKRGYGVTEIDAAQDFIRRNNQATLEKIWDSK